MKTHSSKPRKTSGRADRSNPRAGDESPVEPNPNPIKSKRERSAKKKSQSATFQIKNILERVSDGFVAFDANMNYTYVNQRGGELLGRKPEDLIGKNYWVEYPEAKGSAFANAYVHALKEQTPLQIEDYYEPFDRWFENRVYPSKEGLAIFFHDITDRKKAELKLRDAQERLALAIHSANIGLWDWDFKTNQVYFSPEWKSQLGYEVHEISNDFSEWESRVHPEDLERATATVSGYIENPYPNFQNEFRMQHKDGSYRWILAEASLVMDEQGKPIRMIGSHIDITERKRAEKLIQSERDFSEHALNSLPGVFYMYDEDRKFLRWNKNFEKVTGYTSAEIARMDPLDFFAGKEKDLLAERIQEVFNIGESHVEADFVAKDGTHTPYYFTGRTIQVDEKNCLVGVGVDITERKRAEEALHAHRQLLETVVNYIPASVSLLRGSDLRLQLINPAYQAIAPGKEMLGMTWDELWEETGQNFTAICHQVLETGEPYNVVDELNMIRRTPEGPVEPAYFSWSLHRVRLPGDDGWGLLGTAWETTDRKRVEDEVRLSRDRLAELSRQLVQTHETESRAIGRELHDQIGQMLTALKLIMETAPQLPHELRERKHTQAQELVDDLMNRVSRLSLELRPPMLDDLGLIPALLWHVNRYQEQTNIEVDFKHSGAEGIRFDVEIETTAYRVVQESLTNVARHAHATRASLEVRVSGEWMEIQVEDNGAGFDPQAAFDKHRGLSGMRERVNLLGGSFQIESQSGKGAKKFIRLLLKEKTV